MASDTKTCPECAEEVKSAAKVCRYCGHRFDAQPASAPAKKKRSLLKDTMVAILLVLGAGIFFAAIQNEEPSAVSSPNQEGATPEQPQDEPRNQSLLRQMLPDDEAQPAETSPSQPAFDPEPWKAAVLDMLRSEDVVVEALFPNESDRILWVSVYDDGTERTGLAEYFCLRLIQEGMPAGYETTIRIWDAQAMAREEMVGLARYQCENNA